MTQYSVLPKKYQFDLLPQIDSYSHCRIYDNELIIKEYESCCYNLSVLDQIIHLDLPGYSFAERIYCNEDLSKFYLVGPFYKDYCSISDADFIISDKVNGLIIMKKMLLQLKEAHKKGFNPYDNHGGNYIVNSFLNVLGIDCDFSCFRKQFTFVIDSIPAYFEDFFDNDMFIDFQFSSYYLNLFDKFQMLDMFFYYLRFNEFRRYNIFGIEVLNQIKPILRDIPLPNNVQNYLQKLFCGMIPNFDDYFIEELIDPLICYYANQNVRKRKGEE